MVRVDPESRLHQHYDYFGTTVIEFGISRPHDHLSIDVRARVKTAAPEDPPEAAVGRRSRRRRTGPRRASSCSPTASRTCSRSTSWSVSRAPRARWPPCAGWSSVIPDRFEYRAGVTFVGSTVADLLETGAGVCQDFAHLALLLLRRHGIAARYVSGYLWAPPSGDEGAESAEVETHAWIEALLPGRRRAGLGAGRSHQPHARRRDAREDRARPASTPTCRRSRACSEASAGAELSASVKMTRTDASRRRGPDPRERERRRRRRRAAPRAAPTTRPGARAGDLGDPAHERRADRRRAEEDDRVERHHAAAHRRARRRAGATS